MTHEQTERLIGAVIAFLLVLLSIFGYNVAVVQPELRQMEQLRSSPSTGNFFEPDCAAVLQCVEAGK